MAQRKVRTKAGRTATDAQTPRVYRMPGLRVSVVRERWVLTCQRPILASSAALAAALAACIPEDTDREHFVMAILDVRQRLLGVHTVSVGCSTGTVVHPREVFRVALLAGASSLGVGHNHPSGDAQPSDTDITLTKRLARCAELLGISFHDHIIFGRGMRWLSLRQLGCLEEKKRNARRKTQPKAERQPQPVPKLVSGS